MLAGKNAKLYEKTARQEELRCHPGSLPKNINPEEDDNRVSLTPGQHHQNLRMEKTLKSGEKTKKE